MNYLKQITRNTWVQIIVLFAIMILIAMTCTSCSYQESLFVPQADKIIVWCDYDYIYYYDGDKLDSIRNTDHEMFYSGDVLLIENTFTYVGGLYP